MIIARSPLRVTLGGGGTDLPSYYEQHGGFLIAAAIDKYVYITLHETFVPDLIVKYSELERVAEASKLKHPIIREAFALVGVGGQSLELTAMADIPAGTGLGSSGSFTTALLKALHAHKKNLVHPAELAAQACEVEMDRLKEPIGKQDQYIAAFGGLKCIQFNPDETVYVDPIICRFETKRRLEESLLLLYTGKTRSADTILREQARRTASDDGTAACARKLSELARDLRRALCENRSDIVGELMHNAWETKKQMAPGISSEQIDLWYDRARAQGAIGGKILGAGGGGFLLLYAPLIHQERIIRALPELRRVPFRFEPQGSKIIYVEEPLPDPRPPAADAAI